MNQTHQARQRALFMQRRAVADLAVKTATDRLDEIEHLLPGLRRQSITNGPGGTIATEQVAKLENEARNLRDQIDRVAAPPPTQEPAAPTPTSPTDENPHLQALGDALTQAWDEIKQALAGDLTAWGRCENLLRSAMVTCVQCGLNATQVVRS